MDENIITFPKADGRSGFVPTQTAKRIFLAMDEVIREAPYGSGGLGLIVGPPGIGKTEAVKAYGPSRGIDVAIALIEAANNRPKGVLQTIYSAISGHRIYAPLRETYEAIVFDLDRKSSSRPDLLVIDEAQEADKSLPMIRQLQDHTGVPVILCGNSHLTKLIKGRKTQVAFSQIASRTVQELHLTASTKNDIAAFCHSVGLDDREAVEAICRAGNLRDVATIARKAARFAGAFNAVRAKHVEAAIEVRNGHFGGEQ